MSEPSYTGLWVGIVIVFLIFIISLWLNYKGTQELTIPSPFSQGLDVAVYDFGSDEKTTEMKSRGDTPWVDSEYAGNVILKGDADWNFDKNPIIIGEKTFADYYGIKATGYLVFPKPGTYSIKIRTNDGGRLYRLAPSKAIMCDGWDKTSVHDSTEYTYQAMIIGEKLPIELWQYEWWGGSSCQIYWKTPTNNEWEIIPAVNIVH